MNPVCFQSVVRVPTFYESIKVDQSMRTYIIRRLLLVIPTLILVSMIVFGGIRLIPGDVVLQLVEEHTFVSTSEADETIDAIRAKLGLDVPIHIQYVRWLNGIFTRGSIGVSLWKGTEVSHLIAARLPTSIELVLLSTLISVSFGITLGAYSAIRQDTFTDFLLRGIAIAFLAIPNFWIGIMVIVFPSIWWGWIPPLDYVPFFEDPIANLELFLIPSLLVGAASIGWIMRMMRTMMLEVLRQDYIRTAWSKGLKERQIISRHALKNALIPVVTGIGNSLPILIASSVVVEQIFSLPGVGRLLLSAIASRDYTIIVGATMFIACTVVVINLIVDITYAYLDPRIQYR